MNHRYSVVSRALALLSLMTVFACHRHNVPDGVLAETPNLVPTAVDFSPTTIVTGESITVTETVRNIGSRTAGSFTVGIYLSTDDTIDIDDVLLGMRKVDDLPVAGFSNRSGQVAVKAPAGTYFVGVIANPDGQLIERHMDDNALTAPEQLVVLPSTVDLVVSTSSHDPCTVRRGNSIRYSNTVTNVGGDPSDAIRVGIYASRDKAIDTSDLLLASRIVDELGPGQDSAAVTEIMIDLGPGDWFLGAVADIDDTLLEADETNNATASTSCGEGKLTVDQALNPPDLELTVVVHGGCAIEQGQGIRVDNTVRNSGAGAAGPFRVAVYASQDNVITRSDNLLSSRDVAGLVPSATSVGGANVDVELPPGTWFIGAIADDGNDVVEGNESNNNMLSTSCDGKLIVSPRASTADLEMLRFSHGVCTIEEGGELIVSEAVRNGGDVASGPFRVAVYASQDDLVTRADRLLGVRTVQDLGPGSTTSNTARVKVNVTSREYFLGAFADDLDVVRESNEDNNSLLSQSCSGKLVVTEASQLPNLILRKLGQSSCSVERGNRVSFTFAVANDERRAAGAFRVGIYGSKDANITATDVLIGSRSVSSLGGFASVEVTESYRINLAPGEWFLGAIADDRRQIDESNEADNIANSVACSGKLTVSGSSELADLAVERFQIGQCSVVQGERAEFGVCVENLGNTAAGPFKVGIFADTQPDVTKASKLIGVIEIPGLAPGRDVKKTLRVPLNLPVGTFWVAAIADYENLIRDANRKNNRLLSQSCGGKIVVKTPPGRPDLTVRLFSHLPCAVRQGHRIGIIDCVRNEGAIATGKFSIRIYASTDKDIDPRKDHLIAYRSVKDLPAGRYSARCSKPKIKLRPGRYWLGIVVGPAKGEVDLSDNIRLSSTCRSQLWVYEKGGDDDDD